ncbi:unnamed protein product [Scytosiphon promiscuus]
MQLSCSLAQRYFGQRQGVHACFSLSDAGSSTFLAHMSSSRATRQGPARARALARQHAAEVPESATAWLNGSHEAIALHPEWQQLHQHLQDLVKGALRAYLEETHPHTHPHAIEAARQVFGDVLLKHEADELFSGKEQPHLLHEPYMSAEGAAGLLGQTLAQIARKVDHEAEKRSTLASPRFEAFHRLVSSVYVGSLQKRAEYAERSERMEAQASTTMLDTPQESQQATRNDKPGRRVVLPSVDEQRAKTGGHHGDENEKVIGTNKMGTARPGYQACSGDIAQALVAIAMGGGFERFSSAEVAGDDGAHGKGAGGAETTDTQASTSIKGRRGKFGGGTRAGAEGVAGPIDGTSNSSSSAQQHLLQYHQERENRARAAAGLHYLSENTGGGEYAAAGVNGLSFKSKRGGNSVGSAAVEREGSFPGLEWLAPHIIGRSIPMELRRELWQRTLLGGEGCGPSPAEVERLIIRYAGEKGIVDPTNTPIAGMVATGVRHRAAEAFPWLSRGGAREMELRQRVCCAAEKLLNQYFVFVGKHESRRVASSLVLTYVFDRESTTQKSDGGDSGGRITTSARLVAMLHNLSTRFAPEMGDLRRNYRTRAYDEIRTRDAPLFEHLSTLFPAYKVGVGEKDDIRDTTTATPSTIAGEDEARNSKGLVETWLEDVFVGYLREDALLFVWDHLFLLGWQDQLPLFVADVALHLRASLLRVTNPMTLMSLARDACRRICTRDVRDAFRVRHGAETGSDRK